ncbi:glycosyltransferase family 87 protein [Leptolyngbya sp. AS-A5]|uniref:glycosyltransferase family 87 protein n=2 Tax=unclassified Leptolyngbya TaxID=2650499 RepID=UPI003296EA58
MSQIPIFLKDLFRFMRAYFTYLLPSVFIVYLVLESYQIDFRPYYIAGKSVLYGLDPYINHVTKHPEFFVPVNAGEALMSGFIYLPIAALFFTPLAIFSYSTAKIIYSSFILILLWLLLFELVRRSNFKIKGEALLFAMTSFPVLAAFERGQIDILVCYLTILGFFLHQQHRQRFLAGALFGLAFCIKLFPAIAILYFIAKRQVRVVLYSFASIVVLLLAPLPILGNSIYTSYLKRMLPGVFAGITSEVPITVHGQTVINRVVMSVDSTGLRVTHDFVHGFMNPFLRGKPIASLTVGFIAFLILMYYLRRESAEHQFFSIVNCIHLFNPQTWIMGIVWFIPLFVYLFGKANHLGKFVLILPLFMPPFLNSSGMLAYAVTLLFAIPQMREKLLAKDDNYQLNQA